MAYDFKTGKQLWETTIAAPETGETVSAAPIAWNGCVFIGNALEDLKGVRRRMYALAADGGRIVWETYLVPKAPGDPIRGPQGRMLASANTTWKNAPDVPMSGGTAWTSCTLDPVTGRLYVAVANGERGLSPQERLRHRSEYAEEWLCGIHDSCLMLALEALPGSALGQAVTYTLNMWKKLRRCFDYAEVELSNNLAENSMRGVVLGRRNRLHVGSAQAGSQGRRDSFDGGILPAGRAREGLSSGRAARHVSAQAIQGRLAHLSPMGCISRLTRTF